jgi:BirA family biotin operon repressor/biotin-[acetyl-CoA-carboxylase] ligase
LTVIIIGVGINFKTPSLSLDSTRYNLQPTSLEILSSDSFDKSQFTASLILSIMNAIRDYDEYGFDPFFERYKKYDFLKGKNITVETNNDNLSGLNDGISEDGALVIINEIGRHRIINGSIIHIEK